MPTRAMRSAPASMRLGVGQRVGRVGVAGPRRGEDVLACPGDRAARPSRSTRRPRGADTRAASITSFSRAQMRSAETSPPSCPVPCTLGVGGPGQDASSPRCPTTSSSVRGRPKRKFSMSGSQVRKRGQARVQRVQPFCPVRAVVRAAVGRPRGRACSARRRRRTRARRRGTRSRRPSSPVQSPEVTTSVNSSAHCGFSGGIGHHHIRPGVDRRIPSADARDPRSRALPRRSRRRPWGATIAKVAMVDSRYGRGGTTTPRLRRGADRSHLLRGTAPGEAPAARHRRRPDPRPALRHDRRTGGRRSAGA